MSGSAEFSLWSKYPRIGLSAWSGLMYFIVGTAGTKALFQNQDLPKFSYALNTLGALGCYYNVHNFLGMTLKKPTTHAKITYAGVVAGFFSAFNFYTGGRVGAELLGFPNYSLELAGLLCFIVRAYICARSVLSFVEKISDWAKIIQDKNYVGILRMTVALAISACAALFNTDPLLFAIKDTGLGFLGPATDYVLMGFLAISGFPFAAFWTQYGVQKISQSPTLYTLGAVGFSLLAYSLTILGSATSPHGEAFTSWIGHTSAYFFKISVLPISAVLVSLPGTEKLVKQSCEKLNLLKTKMGSCFTFNQTLETKKLAFETPAEINMEVLVK